MDPSASKRETILQATFELVQKHGLNALTTAKIARKSGTAETIIYRHFEGKQTIVTELLQRVGQNFHTAAAIILAEKLSPIEKLNKITAQHLNFIQQTHGMMRILFSEQVHLASPSDPFKQAARSLSREYRGCVKQVIDEGITNGYFVSDLNSEIASLSYMGLHYLLMHEWALNDFAGNITDFKDSVIEYFYKAWTKRQ